MMHRNQIATGLTLCASLLLSGCTALRSEVSKDVVDNTKLAAKLQHEATTANQYKQVEVTDNVWLGPFNWGSASSVKPPELTSYLSYTSRDKMPLPDALSLLSSDSGIQISMDKSTRLYLGIQADDNSGSSNKKTPEKKPAQVNGIGNIIQGPVNLNPDVTQGSTGEYLDLTYFLYGKKTLEQWLDDIALKFGLFWNYTYVDNRPYVTFSATTDADIQFDGLLSQNSASSTTASAEATNQKESATAWEEIQKYANDVKSKIGSVHFSAGTGRIYISDRPEIVEKVRNRVAYENNVYSKQIHYTVEMLTVNLNQAESYRGGIDGIFKDLSSALNMDSGVSLGSGVSVAYQRTGTSAMSGSELKASLSNSLAKRVTIEQKGFISRNRSVINQHYKDVESYVKTITTSTTDNGTVVSPEINDLQEGIQFQYLGSILSGNRVAMDLSFSQTYVKSKVTQEFNNNSITLPTVNDTAVLNQFIVNSGQTFILSDTTVDSSSNDTGPGKVLGLVQLLFGGVTESNKANSARFFIITPTIISDGV